MSSTFFAGESLRSFIDATMLFGGRIQPPSPCGASSLEVMRSDEKRRSLVWWVVVAEQHGLPVRAHTPRRRDLPLGVDSDSVLLYRSEQLPLMAQEYGRWYPNAQLATPEDLELTLPALTVWTVAALSATYRFDDSIDMLAPPMAPLLAERLCQDARAIGWDARIKPNGYGLWLPGAERERLGAQLTRLVPRAVWDVDAPVSMVQKIREG